MTHDQPNLACETLRELAITMRDDWFPNLSVLPYNRFDIDHAQYWWLSPTPEKAAFAHSKLIFTTDDAWVPDGDVFCGFSVEKGVLSDALDKPGWVMQPDWFWHSFLNRIDTELPPLVSTARAITGLTLQLFLSAGVPTPGAARDLILFDIEGGGWEQSLCELPDGILSAVADCTGFDNLATTLRQLDDERHAWHWFDIAIGSSFTMNVDAANDVEVCASMLTTFLPWVQQSQGATA